MSRFHCMQTRALLAALLGVGSLAASERYQSGHDIEAVALSPVAASERLVVGDDFDRLAAEVAAPERFADHRPAWRVERRTFSFQHYDKTVTKRFAVVLDGDREVAVLRSGDFIVCAQTPADADRTFRMPTERLHLDNLPGPLVLTWPWFKDFRYHGAIYWDDGDGRGDGRRWEVSDRHLALVQRRQTDAFEVAARWVFTVDPVFGYRLDVQHDLSFPEPVAEGAHKLHIATFTPGCYVPWAEASWFDRTVYTPPGGGLRGWANNLLAIDRSDSGKDFAWRDGGFIGYLPAPGGWGWLFTRQDRSGPTVKLSICNAHNDFHSTIPIPELTLGNDGRARHRWTRRLLAVPPEIGQHLWDTVDLNQRGHTTLIIAIGATEDFEAQPKSVAEPHRGLVWTARHPEIVSGDARSGEQSIRIAGRSWPNLPQVSLVPGRDYRLEGWFKIEPWSEEQRQAAVAKAQRNHQRAVEWARAKGKPVPSAPDLTGPPEAYIRGDYYQWSPHSDPMVVEQTTTRATRTDGAWEHVVLDFTVPDWGPFINISFHADRCTALLDDFTLIER